jgi:hypothetical protein
MALKEAEMMKLALLVPVVLALAVSACSSGGSEGSAGSTGGGGAAEGSVEAGAGGAVPKASDRSVSSSAVPQVGPQVVKTASLGLGIGHGSFEDKVGEAHAVADAFGGFIVESFASQGSGKRIAEGSLVLRIPAESYDTALSRLRQLGKVESLEESGQDVSKEFVDLNCCSAQTTCPRRWRSRTSSPRCSSTSSRRVAACSTSTTALRSRRSR